MEHLISTLVVFSVVLPLLLGTLEFASYMTYGGFLKSKDVIKAIDFHLPKGASLNPYDTNIITIGNMPFISTTKSVLGYYYISDVGRVWLFSPAHRRISELHDFLLKEVNKEPKPTIEELLKMK